MLSFESLSGLFTFGVVAVISLIPSASANFIDCGGVNFLRNSIQDPNRNGVFVQSAGSFIFDSIWGSYWYLLDHDDECSTHKYIDSNDEPLMFKVCIDKDEFGRQRYKNQDTARCFVGQATDNFLRNFAFGEVVWYNSQDVQQPRAHYAPEDEEMLSQNVDPAGGTLNAKDHESPFVIFANGSDLYNWIWGSYWYLLDNNDDCSTHKANFAGLGDPIMIKICIDKDNLNRRR
ncbi:hypothetical protein HDU97_003333 [Phlyctochytrium planicorne]|nr:hypothetical protein HDU97_003333 [Phlyctochytrium planicorne]